MARYVIDPVTLLHLIEQGTPSGPRPSTRRAQLDQIGSPAASSAQVRRGGRTEANALALHEQVTELKMRLLGDRASRSTAWKIAREHDWDLLRDAEYLAITRLQADVIVTVDPMLAARANGVVAVAPIESLLRTE